MATGNCAAQAAVSAGMGKAPSPLRRFIHAAVADFERGIDRVEDLLSAGEGHDAKVRLLAYAGYRNDQIARLRGRVVRYEKPLDAGEGMVTRLRAMMEIYNSHELPGVAVHCDGYGQSADTVTDEEGYFTFELEPDGPLPNKTRWEQVTLSSPGRPAQAPDIKVPVIAPGTDDHWGVISDIDDTVVETGATNFVKNWRRVLVERPQDRLAVPGASTLYKMIAGDHVAPVRPFFYVSSSPWNLYGFIAEFMELNGIPHGPMFLKDYGIDDQQLIRKGHDEHKLAAIETVLAFYPGFRFLLIGDNGQKDVEIYARAVRDYPGRIGAVFIRDVAGACREGAKAELLAGIAASGIPTFCGVGFDDAVAVAKALDLDRPLEAAKAVVEKA
ncbi:MAG TPA: phosphatase domain-containing protein [Allosphingosinicella sp.]|nr:phosphatase domain-containing protein [Allosphingosinicella sp.]